MTKGKAIEALNNNHHDIMDQPEALFGGKTVVVGGDFRQVLLVIPR
jgi:ATP-dependent DNA helicase PIF1